MHNSILRINPQNVTKFQKFVNWKFKKFLMTQIFTYLKFCYIFYITLSCQVVTKGHTNLKNLQLLAVDGCLLQRSINGLNSHNNHSVISTLIIDSIDYWIFTLKIYLKRLLGEICSSGIIFLWVILLWGKGDETFFTFFPRQLSPIS